MKKSHPHYGAKVVKNPDGFGYRIKYKDGSISPEGYGSKKGAQAMIEGTFGSVGGIR